MRCEFSATGRFTALLTLIAINIACDRLPANPSQAETKPAEKPFFDPDAGLSEEAKLATYRLFESIPIKTFEQKPEVQTGAETIRPELKDAFCIHAYKLPLYAPTKFMEELAVLCDAGHKPSETFATIDRLASVVGKAPQAIQIALEHQGQLTKAVFATAYALPIPPKWVRSGTIQDFMTQPSEFPYAKLYGRVDENLTDSLQGDLQFSKYKLYYETRTTTPDGKIFSNNRTTQFDAYQVQGGNPDIGLGGEFMVQHSGHYEYFNTITVTIGTKSGGSVVITIVRLAVNNNGYPDIAASLVSDTMLSQATNVHDGLIATLQQYIVP